MVNFSRSNSQAGQQIYMAVSVGNDPTGEVLLRGVGGYLVSGYEANASGKQTVTVSYTVVDHTRTSAFNVVVR